LALTSHSPRLPRATTLYVPVAVASSPATSTFFFRFLLREGPTLPVPFLAGRHTWQDIFQAFFGAPKRLYICLLPRPPFPFLLFQVKSQMVMRALLTAGPRFRQPVLDPFIRLWGFPPPFFFSFDSQNEGTIPLFFRWERVFVFLFSLPSQDLLNFGVPPVSDSFLSQKTPDLPPPPPPPARFPHWNETRPVFQSGDSPSPSPPLKSLSASDSKDFTPS